MKPNPIIEFVLLISLSFGCLGPNPRYSTPPEEWLELQGRLQQKNLCLTPFPIRRCEEDICRLSSGLTGSDRIIISVLQSEFWPIQKRKEQYKRIQEDENQSVFRQLFAMSQYYQIEEHENCTSLLLCFNINSGTVTLSNLRDEISFSPTNTFAKINGEEFNWDSSRKELLLSIYNWCPMEVSTYMEPSDGRCHWIGFDADVFQMDGKRASPLLLTTSPEYSGDITVLENKQEWYVK